MRWLSVLAVLALSGCAMLRGPEAQYEGSLSCKGKVALTGNGSLSIGAGYGGSGTNAWTLQGDCGEGFTIDRHRERQKGPTDPVPTESKGGESNTSDQLRVPSMRLNPGEHLTTPPSQSNGAGASSLQHDDGRAAVEWLLKR